MDKNHPAGDSQNVILFASAKILLSCRALLIDQNPKTLSVPCINAMDIQFQGKKKLERTE